MQCLSQKLASSSSIVVVFLPFLVSLFLLESVDAVIKLPKGVKVPAILVFGDSIVDPGNNNDVKTLVRCNFAPYGRDFNGGTPTGRFSNGRIPSDLIAHLCCYRTFVLPARELGVKDLLPAYLDPSLKLSDLLTGVSFASGGSGYDPLTPQIVSVISLPDQLKYFKEYINKIKATAGEKKTAEILSESLYIVVAGSDDIANTYFSTPFRRLKYDIPAYTDLMLQGASSFVQELYKLGAKRVGVFSTPPIGCVPSQRTLGGGKQRQCAEDYNIASKLFNTKLSSELSRLTNKYKPARFVYIDIYNPLFNLIQNPQSSGFEVASNGCCGTGLVETVVLCNELSPFTCKEASKYIFWDGYHPTERAYEVLFTPVIKKYVNSFFCGGGSTVC
ncbi:hypothetical protein GIB67_016149 [Kingdonia uniflora]|uniref:GDSL esterase/lipase EXL3 n=1 Tax=Kingdonia uniflora TaxID=39325 RepID=A0A7J7N987_9MAGN|nr:hypothetical protein GIB67_016149 [Kingdonia uniflora]